MKFPFIYQHDSMQCGVSCLFMVCKYFRQEFSISFLSNICISTTEGVSLLGIREAAEKVGLKTVLPWAVLPSTLSVVCFVDIAKTLGVGKGDFPDPRCPESVEMDVIL